MNKYITLSIALTVVITTASSVHAQEDTTQEPAVVIQENQTIVEQAPYAQSIINQQNTVIHHHPTPLPPPVITNEFLTLSISDNRDSVRPSQSVDYRITLRNHTHEDLNNILVRLEVPLYYIPDTTHPQANTLDPQRRVIEWKSQLISAGSEVSYTVKGQAEQGAPNRTELIARVLVNGPGIHQEAADSTTILTGAIAGTTTTTTSTGQTITVIEPAAVAVRPTAATGATLPFVLTEMLATLIGGIGLHRVTRFERA